VSVNVGRSLTIRPGAQRPAQKIVNNRANDLLNGFEYDDESFLGCSALKMVAVAYTPLKRRSISTRLHDATSQKAVILKLINFCINTSLVLVQHFFTLLKILFTAEN
jgi:hypothetical protein